MLLFGSRASGLAGEASDFDVLALVPEGIDPGRRRAARERLQAEFPTLRLDLVIGSERALLSSLRYEPARPFWLENAIPLWGRKPVVERYPPLAKGALLSYLNRIEAEIGVARAEDDDRMRCRICADALEHLVQLEHALAGSYNNGAVRQTLADLMGHDLFRALRSEEQPFDPGQWPRLLRISRNRLRAIRQRVSALPENESDLLWREQWREGEPAEAT